jgi:hypothetical protein
MVNLLEMDREWSLRGKTREPYRWFALKILRHGFRAPIHSPVGEWIVAENRF